MGAPEEVARGRLRGIGFELDARVLEPASLEMNKAESHAGRNVIGMHFESLLQDVQGGLEIAFPNLREREVELVTGFRGLELSRSFKSA